MLVNDTMQTFDPAIYAVGECVQHRKSTYGLVAPLWEQARVCALHLAEVGLSRYRGSMVSTQLKVTGIDLFSAGDFVGGAGSEALVSRTRAAASTSESWWRTTRCWAPCCTGIPGTALVFRTDDRGPGRGPIARHAAVRSRDCRPGSAGSASDAQASDPRSGRRALTAEWVAAWS